MTCIPCKSNAATTAQIDEIAEILKTQAHTIEKLGLTERELYDTGLFRGAIERIRGQFVASMYEKRTFAKIVLNHLEDLRRIVGWSLAEGHERYNYDVRMPCGRSVALAMKGCLDGDNTTLYERPAHAQEFYIWSVCMNAGANPRKNAWSGIHSRLAGHMHRENEPVDGLIIWDMVCGTIGRPCPKMAASAELVEVGPYRLPPPCTYAFPRGIADPEILPIADAQPRSELTFMTALEASFGPDPIGRYDVSFEVRRNGEGLERMTRVRRGGATVQTSKWQHV